MKVDEDKVKDLLSLASSDTTVSEFIEQIKQCVADPSLRGSPNLPPRSVQLAGLLLAQAVWLIRRGTRQEVTSASAELSQFIIAGAGEALEAIDPEAMRLISAASVALGAASPAASLGGEEMVLRSWGGEARRLLRLLMEAEGESLPIEELMSSAGLDWGEAVGPFVDLESASLIVRYRDECDRVVVSTLSKGKAPHVRRLISEPA